MNLIFVFVIFFLSFSNVADCGEKPQKMNGAASCSAAACHGGTQKRKNEFTIWSTQDLHRKSYGVLFNQRSLKMARILALKHPPHEDDFCLRCHAVTSDVDRRPQFDISEGVTCEVCHGISEKWLEPHAQKNQERHQSLQLGLVDLENTQIRADTCLRCHGTIDHKLLSAGHPDIVFELDTFSAMMPKHWEDKGSWSGVQAWAVGQAVSLKNHLNFLVKLNSSQDQKSGRRDMNSVADQIPQDEAFKNCFACHHNLYDVRWTLNDNASGQALWDHSRDLALLDFLQVAFPDQYPAISTKIAWMDKAFLNPNIKASELIAASQEITSRLETIIPQIPQIPWSPEMILSIMNALVKEPQAAFQGYHVAEQVYMALDSLSLALPQKSGEWRRLVQKMETNLNLTDPSRYDPASFQKILSQMQNLLYTPLLSLPQKSQKKLVNPKGWWGKTPQIVFHVT